jgi:hypothetical protein
MEGLFTGRSEFRQVVRGLVMAAAARGAREMWWVGPDLADWPLDEPELLDALTHWAHHRTVRLH